MITNDKDDLYKKFRFHDYLYGFKYTLLGVDSEIKQTNIQIVKLMAAHNNAEYLSDLAYPCIYMNVENETWHYFATREQAEVVMRDLANMLGYNTDPGMFLSTYAPDIQRSASL